ncbi:MAG: hypothetical protein CM15mP21_2150 [Hyphomicrobiales bacterium]|nr:MAG: hypothetical protein CM15mP21_2150 [Hyphomicrobiales bacterium]
MKSSPQSTPRSPKWGRNAERYGQGMGLLKQKYTGQMDFGKAGARVKEKLG